MTRPGEIPRTPVEQAAFDVLDNALVMALNMSGGMSRVTARVEHYLLRDGYHVAKIDPLPEGLRPDGT